MPVFAVILNEPSAEVEQRLGQAYPGHFRFTDTVFLVETDGIAESVATGAGIKGNDRIEAARGVVFKLNKSYAGFTVRSLWDWLARAEERQ